MHYQSILMQKGVSLLRLPLLFFCIKIQDLLKPRYAANTVFK